MPVITPKEMIAEYQKKLTCDLVIADPMESVFADVLNQAWTDQIQGNDLNWDALNKLPFQSNAAYVQTGSRIYYLNRSEKTFEVMPADDITLGEKSITEMSDDQVKAMHELTGLGNPEFRSRLNIRIFRLETAMNGLEKLESLEPINPEYMTKNSDELFEINAAITKKIENAKTDIEASTNKVNERIQEGADLEEKIKNIEPEIKSLQAKVKDSGSKKAKDDLNIKMKEKEDYSGKLTESKRILGIGEEKIKIQERIIESESKKIVPEELIHLKATIEQVESVYLREKYLTETPVRTGERTKTNATKDLEIIINAYQDPGNKVEAKYNSLGELEIFLTREGSTKPEIYNLSQILSHEVDFQQIEIAPETLNNYARFIESNQQNCSSEAREDTYIPVSIMKIEFTSDDIKSEIEKAGLKGKAAYVISGDKLYYINKNNNVYVNIPATEGQMGKINEIAGDGNERELTREEVVDISIYTKHKHSGSVYLPWTLSKKFISDEVFNNEIDASGKYSDLHPAHRYSIYLYSIEKFFGYQQNFLRNCAREKGFSDYDPIVNDQGGTKKDNSTFINTSFDQKVEQVMLATFISMHGMSQLTPEHGYDIDMLSENTEIENNMMYFNVVPDVENGGFKLEYTVLDPLNTAVKGSITSGELNLEITEGMRLSSIKQALPEILAITNERKHTLPKSELVNNVYRGIAGSYVGPLMEKYVNDTKEKNAASYQPNYISASEGKSHAVRFINNSIDDSRMRNEDPATLNSSLIRTISPADSPTSLKLHHLSQLPEREITYIPQQTILKKIESDSDEYQQYISIPVETLDKKSNKIGYSYESAALRRAFINVMDEFKSQEDNSYEINIRNNLKIAIDMMDKLGDRDISHLHKIIEQNIDKLKNEPSKGPESDEQIRKQMQLLENLNYKLHDYEEKKIESAKANPGALSRSAKMRGSFKQEGRTLSKSKNVNTSATRITAPGNTNATDNSNEASSTRSLKSTAKDLRASMTKQKSKKDVKSQTQLDSRRSLSDSYKKLDKPAEQKQPASDEMLARTSSGKEKEKDKEKDKKKSVFRIKF